MFARRLISVRNITDYSIMRRHYEMRKRAILCREEHCAVAAEMSLLYEALPSIECKEEEEEGGLSEKGGPTKASDVVGEGGRACLLSPPSLLPSRCCQLQSLSRFLPSLRATICPFLFPLSFLPSCLGSGPAGGTVARGSGTVVGRRGPLRAQTSETWTGGVTAGRAGAGADGWRRASSGAGKANFLISSAGNGERTRIEWGARNGVARIRQE